MSSIKKAALAKSVTRRQAVKLSVGAACSAALASCSTRVAPLGPPLQFYRTERPEELVAVARAIVALDVHGALVTVDKQGVPRARPMSVDLSPDQTRFWMSTRPGSRKLAQIAENEQATLHFPDREQWGYASFMGVARVHSDAETVRARSFFYEEMRERLFPDFPHDMVMIEFRPRWLEVAGRGVDVHPETWQPQGTRILPTPQ